MSNNRLLRQGSFAFHLVAGTKCPKSRVLLSFLESLSLASEESGGMSNVSHVPVPCYALLYCLISGHRIHDVPFFVYSFSDVATICMIR